MKKLPLLFTAILTALLLALPACAADDDCCPETNQIGAARPQGAGCDIGAVEFVDN